MRGSRRPLVEERLVLEPEHGQVDARAHRLDLRRQLVARLVALDEELAGVGDHVGVGQDPLALDDDAGAAGLAGLRLVQGLVKSGIRIVAVIFTTESRIFSSSASSPTRRRGRARDDRGQDQDKAGA